MKTSRSAFDWRSMLTGIGTTSVRCGYSCIADVRMFDAWDAQPGLFQTFSSSPSVSQSRFCASTLLTKKSHIRKTP